MVFTLALGGAACGRNDAGSADTAAAGSSSTASVPQAATPAPVTPTPDPSPSPSPTALTLTPTGIGKLRVGMTVAEARSALGTFSLPVAEDPKGCLHVRPPALPAGVLVMVEGGKVVRVSVDSNTVATAEGARIGDTEARIKTLYGARVATSAHKYTDGHYLTVTPAGDTLHRLIFETDQGKVTRFRGGRVPQVQYVEGCS